MGRLFWKFFLCILLAQLAATVGIGGAFWLQDRARDAPPNPVLDATPPARTAIEAAAVTLESGGANALRSLLVGMERYRVLAVDDGGRELLQRNVSPLTLAHARALLGKDGARTVVRSATGADGRRYLLFLPADQHDTSRFGPAPPGFAYPSFDAGGRLRFGASGPPPEACGPDEVAPGAGPKSAQAPPPSAALAALHLGPRPPRPPCDQRYRAFIPVAGATLASLLFAFLLAWYFSRPIRALRLAFGAASGGDLAPRFAGVAGRRRDELRDLGRDFDHMTGRLRSLIDGRTRLLHDVSHELRSPLARLQAAIGLAHQRPEKMADWLERIERESIRMDKLVGELLTLSRLEAGANGAMGEELCIADLVEEIVGDARFEACARNLTVGIAVTDAAAADARVRGQGELLGRALENVVRNAIKHSPEGGAVQLELGLAEDGRRLCIAVHDDGPGVADGDLQAIFEPFFRAAAHNATEGHGLGLAIARQVILAHRGSIAARNRSEGGLSVEMTLPVAS